MCRFLQVTTCACVALLLALFSAVCGATSTIDFEGLSTGGFGGEGQPVAVFQQFADEGVIFNSPKAIDYSRGLVLTGFAHSGTKGIEQCFAQEFCKQPIEITFTCPQPRVKVWVGSSSKLDTARTVVLRAFDSQGQVITAVQAALGPSPSPVPISSPLEVRDRRRRIARVQIRYVPEDTLMNGLAVDDVEFEVVGPAPPCTAMRAPQLTLSQPVPQSPVFFDEFMLQGSIVTDGPLLDAVLTRTGSSGAQTMDVLSSGPVSRNGGPFGPIRIDGLLSPGPNNLELRASNCTGSATASTDVSLTRGKLNILGTEVNQGLPDYPLAAGKTTLIRVYTASTISGEPVRVTSAQLEVTANVGGITRTFAKQAVISTPIFSNDTKQFGENQNVNFYLLGNEIPAGTYTFVARLMDQDRLLQIVSFDQNFVFSRTDDLRILLVLPDLFLYERPLAEVATLWDYLDDLARILPVRDNWGLLGDAAGLQIALRLFEPLCDGSYPPRLGDCGPTPEEVATDSWARFKWTIVQPRRAGQRRTACQDSNGTVIPNSVANGLLRPVPCQALPGIVPPFRYVNDGSGRLATMVVSDAFLYFPGYAGNTADPTYDLDYDGTISTSELSAFVMEYSQDNGVTWRRDLTQLRPGDIVHSFVDSSPRNGALDPGEAVAPFIQGNLVGYMWAHPRSLLDAYNRLANNGPKLRAAGYVIWPGMEHVGTAGGTGGVDSVGIGGFWAWLDGRPVLFQEFGHSLGLVPANSPNSNAAGGDPPHSRNRNVNDSRAFDPVRRKRLINPISVMNCCPPGSLASPTYSNSMLETAEYANVFNQLRSQLATAVSPVSSSSQPVFAANIEVSRSDEAHFRSSFISTDSPASEVAPKSKYSLVFLGPAKKILRRDPIAVVFETEIERAHLGKALYHHTAQVQVSRPLPTHTVAVEMRHGVRVIGRLNRPPHAPKLEFYPPAPEKTTANAQRLRLRWKSHHPDRARVSYSVYWQRGSGHYRWQPLAVGLQAQAWDLDFGTVQPGPGRIRVEACDGFHVVYAEKNITIPEVKQNALVSIVEPRQDAVATESTPVVLRGIALDPQQGLINGESLQWTSDIEGQLCRGTSCVVHLRAGAHVVTLRAATRSGAESTAQIRMLVK
jgi:hypothetical protein